MTATDTPAIGHNTDVAPDRLRSIVERVERLEDERSVLGEDIKDIYKEAKSGGLDVKTLRVLIRERRADPVAVAERNALLAVYRRALGMS